eukprot:XP_011683303.1 PREDICTED: uncharacterized protein LOC105447211 [Strongylocentrotus purpuratus]
MQSDHQEQLSFKVTGCEDGPPSVTIECDPGSTISISKGVCVRVPSCDAYDPSLESKCDNSDQTARWAPYCAAVNSCTFTDSCSAGSTCPGDYTYIYTDYKCITDETTVPTTLTSDIPETSTEDWTPTPVTGCIGVDSPSIMIECDPGSTINITKGGCVRVPSCDAYDPSLESQCDDGDKTAQWAPYCEIHNPCNITSSCSAGTTCMGEYAYIYVDYECFAVEPTEATSDCRNLMK